MYVRFLSGPFLSALSNKFGHQKVSFVGSILFSLGLVLTSVSPSLLYVYVSYGVIAGGCEIFETNIIYHICREFALCSLSKIYERLLTQSFWPNLLAINDGTV